MKDLLLWQMLHAQELAVEPLLALLEDLQKLPAPRRLPFFSLLERCLNHEASALRMAALRALSGVDGYPGWKLLGAGLHDTEPEVRAHAVTVFGRSAERDPLRWLHVLFHADPVVRRQGLASLPRRFPAHRLLHLLPDVENRDVLAPYLEAFPLHHESPPLLLALYRQGDLDTETLLRWFAHLPRDFQLNDYCATFETGRMASGAQMPRTLAELETTLEAGAREPDQLDDFFGVFWDCLAEDAQQTRILTQSLGAWAEAIRRRALHDQHRDRLALSLAIIQRQREIWLPLPLALCATAFPVILALQDIPLPTRKEAACLLYEEIAPGNLDTLPEEIFQDELCFVPDSASLVAGRKRLDLRVVAGLMRLLKSKVYTHLVQGLFPETETVQPQLRQQKQLRQSLKLLTASIEEDPTGADWFLGFSPHTGTGSSLHLAACRAFLGTHPDQAQALADLSLQVPSNALGFLDDLKRFSPTMPAQFTRIFLHEMQSLVRANKRLPSDKKLDHIAKHIVRQFPAAQLSSLFEILGALDEAAKNPAAMEFLLRISHQFSTPETLAACKALEADVLIAILEMEQDCPNFHHVRQQGMAKELIKHASPEVQQWAATVRPELAALLAPPEEGDAPRRKSKPKTYGGKVHKGIYTLSKAERDRIIEADDVALLEILAEFGLTPLRGICEPLLARPEPLPAVAACCAILCSHDSLEQIAEAIEKYIGGSADFLRKLDVMMVSACEFEEKLPFWARVWMFRYEKHQNILQSELLAWKGGFCAALQWGMQAPSPRLRQKLWQAATRLTARWRLRRVSNLQQVAEDPLLWTLLLTCLLPTQSLPAPFVQEDISFAPTHVDEEIQAHAAHCLLDFYKTRCFAEPIQRIQQVLLEYLTELPKEIVRILQELLDTDGLVDVGPGATRLKAAPEELLRQIRQSEDAAWLREQCLHPHPLVVEEAACQLVAFDEGPSWLIQLFGAPEAPPCPRPLFAALALAETEIPEAFARSVLEDPSRPPQLRFFLLLALCQQGAHDLWPALLELLQCEKCEWLHPDDWQDLASVFSDKEDLAVALITAPQYIIYEKATRIFLEKPDPLDETARKALRHFLEAGERLHALRVKVARRLRDNGDPCGFPVLCVEAFRKASHDEETRTDLYALIPDEWVLSHVRSCLIAGSRHLSMKQLMACLEHDLVPDFCAQKGLSDILANTNVESVQQRALALLKPHLRSSRAHKVARLADSFAWGVRTGRELTGQLFAIDMIAGEQLGYTKLKEPRIFINPMPLLQGQQHGQNIVKGLIIHEFGHHIYHATPDDIKVWDEAQKEGLHSLLNLVSDEHLERNLRTKDKLFDSALKRLAAYAFQHKEKDLEFETLLRWLGAHAFAVLHNIPLRISRKSGHVLLQTGKLLLELESTGMSFARFVRALRMGLGNRHEDPKVAEGLALFRKAFRQSSMPTMLEIARKLRQIFGAETSLLSCFDQDSILADDAGALSSQSDGMTNEEVQREVRRILNPSTSKHTSTKKSTKAPPILALNVNPDEFFPEITRVVRVRQDKQTHRVYAQRTARWSKRMQKYLRNLGLSTVPQRLRISGHRLDRGRLQAAALRGDPRLLISRKVVYKNDLFLGVVVDCSGSMSGESIERARLFGIMLAEATKGLQGVESRFFGFTDQEIYDAGSAQRCAVHALEAGGGNNDAAALWHAAQVALASSRKARLLVMISDGLPTECSVNALRALVKRLSTRMKICCAQIAVRPLEEVCFPHYVEVMDTQVEVAIHNFGTIIAKLVRKALQG